MSLKCEKFILNLGTTDPAEFEALALRAKHIGATHVMVGDLPRSRWMWDRDRSNPYPNWCMGMTQLFKLVCPPELRAYLPSDFITECFNVVKARCDVLERIGLRPALSTNEPFWLPEEVYREHPTWRGARCDHPRRSKHPYYSPNIDNHEVLELYTYAMKELVEKTGIDYIKFMSNDSGGGLPWSNGTYVGPNGPSATKNRSMSERILGFMDALDAGARCAGTKITLCFDANLAFKVTEEGVAEAWRGAKDNYIINGRNSRGERPVASIKVGAPEIPHGVPGIFALAESLGDACKDGKEIVTCYLNHTDFEENWRYIEEALLSSPTDWHGYMKSISKISAEIVGDDCMGLFVDAMYHIHEGFLHFSHDGLGLFRYGIVHQRWINRPFVLFQDELPEEDRSYYRRFQFQALDEKHAMDLLDMQNIECARGFSASFLLSETVKKATQSIQKSITCLEALLEKNAEMAMKASVLIRRLKVYISLMKTCANAAAFQTLVDTLDFVTPVPQSCEWPTRNDMRIEQFQNITRAEIDNAYELATLIEGYESELFPTTNEENEDIFTFGPHLADQIRRKAEIMLDHEIDAARVIEVHNI